MSRLIGTTVRGIRTPIIKEGDDLINIVVESIIEAITNEEITLSKSIRDYSPRSGNCSVVVVPLCAQEMVWMQNHLCIKQEDVMGGTSVKSQQSWKELHNQIGRAHV